VLGVERERVRVHPAKAELTAVDLGSYAARMTLMSGLAAIRAAEQLKERLVDEAAQTLAAPSASVVVRGGKIGVPGDWANAVSFARAAELAEKRHGILSFSASYSPPSADEPVSGGVGSSPCYSYTACVVELTVDVDTGAVELDDVWIAHDIGRALNPVLAQGQIEGCVYMGIGEALMERTSYVHGLPKFPSMLGYKSPTTLEMPQVHTILVESADPGGPFGAKEVGQGPLLPVIPAIANAIFHATGVRIDEVPITPEKVLAALDQRRKGLPARVGPDREPEFRFRKPIVMDSGFGQPVRIASGRRMMA